MAGDKIKQLKGADFDAAVAKGVTLVDFWAEWCGPCRALAPILEQVADRLQGRAVVAKVNVDEERELAVRFGIQSIPTLIVVKDGEVAGQMVGMRGLEDVVAAVEKAL